MGGRNPSLSHAERARIGRAVARSATKYSLDPDLVTAVLIVESGGRPWARSPKGAIGLMQVMPTTGMFVAHFEGISWSSPEKILLDPVHNIRIGSRYLAALIDAYGIEGGLAAYNGGPSRASRWLANEKAEGILPRETANYIPAVLAIYEDYKNPS